MPERTPARVSVLVGNGLVDDDTTCDCGGRDLHQRVAFTPGPCLEVERRKPHYFVGIVERGVPDR